MDSFSDRVLGVKGENSTLLATLHVDFRDLAIGETEDAKVATSRHVDGGHSRLSPRLHLNLHLGDRVIGGAPHLRLGVDRVSGLGLPLGVTGEHVLPVLLAELAKRETFNGTAVEAIVSACQLLFPRKVNALELIEKRNVSQVSILAATDQVSGPLHLGVVEAAIETNHVRCFCVPASLP